MNRSISILIFILGLCSYFFKADIGIDHQNNPQHFVLTKVEKVIKRTQQIFSLVFINFYTYMKRDQMYHL
jgi:hypothetical protein